MRGTPYGQSNLCKFAFAVSVPARRYAVEHAAKHGKVSSLDLKYEFPQYDPSTIRDILVVLSKYGVLRKGPIVPDLLGRLVLQTYVLTDEGKAGLQELHDFTARVLSRLED